MLIALIILNLTLEITLCFIHPKSSSENLLKYLKKRRSVEKNGFERFFISYEFAHRIITENIFA